MKSFHFTLMSLCSSAIASLAVPPSTIASSSGYYSRALAHLNNADASRSSNERLLSLHRSIVSIDSTTGNEYELGQWLAEYFKSINWTVELQPVSGNRSNVLAWPAGVESGKSRILLTSHIDTVPPHIPYSLQDGNTTIWGRGTVDAKGSVAAQIIAAQNIIARKDINLPPDALAVLYVIGEEGTGEGMKYFNLHAPHNYSSVIFGEPTEGDLVCGHKGALGLALNVTGKAAHSGYPELGVDANSILIRAVSKVLDMQNLPSSDKFGNTTVNPGLLQGGAAVNIVSATALSLFAFRLAGGTPAEVQTLIEEELEGSVSGVQELGGNLAIVYPVPGYPPQELSCDIE